MGDMNLSKIRDQITTQITEIKEELKKKDIKKTDPRTKKFVNSINQSYKVLLELEDINISPKLSDDLEKLSEEIEKLKKEASPDVSLLRSVLAVFEALHEELKIIKEDPKTLKRGERVEKVEMDRFE